MTSEKRKNRGFWLFGADARGLTRGRAAAFAVWNALLPLLASLGVGVLSLLLAFGRCSWGVFFGYFRHPLIALLNLAPVVLLYLLLYCAVNRAWIAFLIHGVVVLGLSAVDYFMLLLRDDALLFADLVDAPTAAGIVGHYHLVLDDRLLLCIVFLLLASLFLAFFVRGRMRGSRRAVLAVIAAAVCAFPLRTAIVSASTYDLRTQNYESVNRWSATQNYLSRGFIYPFLHSVTEAFPTAPEGYDRAETEALLAPYRDADIPEDRRVNIVAVMLESFSDLSGWEIPGLSEEVYAGYHALEAESLRGTLVNNIFAGGTINTERCFLTGSGILDNYRKDANSYVWYLRSQGYRTGGSHPCFNWFYNRRNVNRYLGFQEYFFLEDHYGALAGGEIAYDDVFFPELTRLCLEDFARGPSFSFNLNYQGHGPYETDRLLYGEWVERLAYSEEAWTILNNYFGSVKNTADNLRAMVDAFRETEEPVVLVVFGDHKPWLGDANSVYQELGIDLDTGTEEGFYNYYSTRWLIWANDAAKAALGNSFVGEGPDLSPSFLMNYLFRQCGWKGSAFMQYTDTVMDALPVVSAGGICVASDGTFLTELSPEDARRVAEYRAADFWYRRNFLYAASR